MQYNIIGLDSSTDSGNYIMCTLDSQAISCTKYNMLPPSVTPPTPTVSDQDTSMWTLTSLDGSQVERYIVEFECRIRNITFVEKYMSVSASERTGLVATNVSCFGALVKVWEISGLSISRALGCTPNGRCSEEGGKTSANCKHIYIYIVCRYVRTYIVSCL